MINRQASMGYMDGRFDSYLIFPSLFFVFDKNDSFRGKQGDEVHVHKECNLMFDGSKSISKFFV